MYIRFNSYKNCKSVLSHQCAMAIQTSTEYATVSSEPSKRHAVSGQEDARVCAAMRQPFLGFGSRLALVLPRVFTMHVFNVFNLTSTPGHAALTESTLHQGVRRREPHRVIVKKHCASRILIGARRIRIRVVSLCFLIQFSPLSSTNSFTTQH